jgi:hypothetical protein
MLLDNQLNLTLSIDGIDLPLDQLGCPYVQIDSSSELGVPCIYMVLTDQTGAVRKAVNFRDGNLALVNIGQTEDTSTQYPFRLTNPTIQGSTIELHGYLNFPKYVGSQWPAPIKGTSSQALSKIAEYCGMAFSGDSTSDSCLWVPSGGRIVNFARRIGLQSYAGDGKYMMAAITMSGELRYKDVFSDAPSRGVYGYEGTLIPIKDFRPRQNTTRNLFGGYGRSRIGQWADGTQDTHKKISMVQKAGMLNRDSGMATYTGDSITDFGPILHPANVHKNWNAARHANQRYGALLNTGISMSSGMRSPLDVLDRIQLDLTRYGATTDALQETRAYNGQYIILEKGIIIENQSYVERIVAVREGTQREYE